MTPGSGRLRGVSEGERLCGAAIIGRPVARMLDDGFTAGSGA